MKFPVNIESSVENHDQYYLFWMNAETKTSPISTQEGKLYGMKVFPNKKESSE